MKRNRTSSLKSPQHMIVSNSTTCSYLPDECWESILKFHIKKHGTRYLNPLSQVSKQFLYMTDRLRFSLTVYDQTHPFIGSLFKRFTNLTSLNFWHYRCDNLDALLIQISCFPSLNITSLILPYQCTIPANGLRALSKNFTTLASLACSYSFLYSRDLLLIADCFPLLKELNLGHPLINMRMHVDFVDGIHSLSSKCRCIQHLDLTGTCLLNDRQVSKLSLLLGDLMSINLSECQFLTELSLLSLVRNCRSLLEIKMESTSIGRKGVKIPNFLRDFAVSPPLKSLCLARCERLRDENIVLFTSVFPNLEVLDLSHWKGISEEIISQVLKCSKIKHLNLSSTNVDDKSLYMISRSCSVLLQLILENCNDVTENGLKQVVENCTQLREHGYIRHYYSKVKE